MILEKPDQRLVDAWQRKTILESMFLDILFYSENNWI